jgi:hypothetical protein
MLPTSKATDGSRLQRQLQEPKSEHQNISNPTTMIPDANNKATLLKLAVSSVIQSIKNNPEGYRFILCDLLLVTYYNPSCHVKTNTNNWITQNYETVLVNEAIKLYDKLSKNFVEEVLNNHDVHASQSV